MPELPDISVYIEALEQRVLGEPLEQVRLTSPFLLRTWQPPLDAVRGKPVEQIQRLGKRIAFGLEGDLWLVLHLMIAGRLDWRPRGAKPPGRRGLAAFDFRTGTLILTEAGTKKRASLHLLQGREGLAELDLGGLEPLQCTIVEFSEAIRSSNHTLKRALTSPRIFSGIGNAYSDEILHAARLSPVKLTQRLDADEIERLYQAARETLELWIERLRAAAGGDFPKKVTAFRKEMAVHGKFGQPCPICGAKVRRIRYADNETNYCPRCQTGGKVLADRALSRLLKQDWPRTIDEWEGSAAEQASNVGD